MLPFPIPAELQKELEDKFKETVKAVLKWAFAQTGLEDKLKKKLGLDPVEKALQASLARAFIQFEHDDEYGHWIQQGFDPSFFEKEAAAELAKFLLADCQPDPSTLADSWAVSFNLHRDRRTVYTRQLEPVAAKFLELFESQLKQQSALDELVKKRTDEEIAQAVKNIRDSLNAGKATPGTRLDYLRWLLDCYQYIDLRGVPQTQRQVQLKLDEIYVSLQAQRDEIPGTALDRRLKEQELADLRRDLESRHTPASEVESQLDELAARLDQKLDRRSLTPETLDLSAVVAENKDNYNKNNRLVILGDPGSGKSTLLKYLAVKHAQAALAKQSYAGDNLGVTRLPILLRISEYAVNSNWRNLSLSDFLPKSADINDCPAEGLADLLATELTRGNCLVLLDGLDEIVTGEERAGIVDKIEKFVNSHSVGNNRFIVTSRFAGYSSAPLASSFVHYGIQDMSLSQIEGFLERWCRAVEDAQTPDIAPEIRAATARREINGIMASIKNAPGVKRLATNPLLLTILALIHRTGARLPQKRVDLYKLASEVLARYWREAKGIPVSAVLEDSYLNLLLSEMAYWLHTHRATGIATEREVYEVMGRELFARKYGRDKEWEEDNPEIRKDVSLFLQAVRIQTGLFVERAPQRYGFMHLTFEEYYVAKYLTRRRKDTARLIHQHKTDPRWTEPILLALGLVGNESSDDAAEIIETAILAEGPEAKAQGFQPSEYEDLFGRDYRLALRCIGDMVTTDRDLTKRLGERLVDEYVYKKGLGEYRRYTNALDKQIEHLGSSNKVLSETILSKASNALISPDWTARAGAVSVISYLELTTTFAEEALLNAIKDKNIFVRLIAARSLSQIGVQNLEIKKVFIDALLNVDESTRMNGIRGLKELGLTDGAVADALLNALSDENELIRLFAARAFGELKLADAKVQDGLINALNDKDVHVREGAIQSLGSLGITSTSIRDILIAVSSDLSDSNGRERMYGVIGLGDLGLKDEEVYLCLSNALFDKNRWVRMYTAFSLVKLGLADNIQALLFAKMSEIDWFTQFCAASSLAYMRLADSNAHKIIIDALSSADAETRITAARCLGYTKFANKDTRDVLINSLNDTIMDVRMGAAMSLGNLELADSFTHDALLTCLSDASEYVRINSIRSLDHLNLADEKTAKLLTSVLSDSDDIVRLRAAKILGKIGGQHLHIKVELIKNLTQILDGILVEQLPRDYASPYQDAYDCLWQLIIGPTE